MTYKLMFKATRIKLPDEIDETWEPPSGMRLEKHAKEIHLHHETDPEPCAGWQSYN